MSPKPNIETCVKHVLITEKYISFGTLITTGNCNKKRKREKKRKRKESLPINLFPIILFRKGRTDIRMVSTF
jgi:hypothetical protein